MISMPNGGTPRPESGGFLPTSVEDTSSGALQHAKQRIANSMGIHVSLMADTLDGMTKLLTMLRHETVVELAHFLGFSVEEVSRALRLDLKEVEAILEVEEGKSSETRNDSPVTS